MELVDTLLSIILFAAQSKLFENFKQNTHKFLERNMYFIGRNLATFDCLYSVFPQHDGLDKCDSLNLELKKKEESFQSREGTCLILYSLYITFLYSTRPLHTLKVK